MAEKPLLLPAGPRAGAVCLPHAGYHTASVTAPQHLPAWLSRLSQLLMRSCYSSVLEQP